MQVTRKRTKGKTEAKGLGWRHAQQRSRLIRKHHDGDTCWWCGQPMWRDPHQNWDNKPLAADHIQPRAQGARTTTSGQRSHKPRRPRMPRPRGEGDCASHGRDQPHMWPPPQIIAGLLP